MSLSRSAFIVLAVVLAAPVALSAAEAWSKNSASDFSLFVTLQRFRIYADHCSARVPQLKPGFESRMENLSRRMQGISTDLLTADAFKGMKDKPVPAEIVFAFKDALEDTEHNFERQDAAAICPKTLRNLDEMDDESLKSGLSEILAAVHNMIRNLEK